MGTVKEGDVVRIGLMSRVDYGCDGYRQGLLELAAEIFKKEDIHFVILAGGLISGRAIIKKQKKLRAEFRTIKSLAAKQERLIASGVKEGEKPGKLEPARKKLADLQKELNEAESALSELEPEALANELAKRLPHFTNSSGERVRLYIVTSPAYDKETGEAVVRLLADERKDDIRVWKASGDRFDLKQVKKILETLTPEKATWLRGDYYSTPVERVLKDKRKQTAQELPDLDVVGCFGSTITKPQGEIDRPYASLPVLHRLEEATVAENQIGVRVMEIRRGKVDPIMRNYPFKDIVSHERLYIVPPESMPATAKKLIDALKARGRLTTGLLADATELSRETVERTLKKELAEKRDKRLKSWPGLTFDEAANRWDFNLAFMQDNLRYEAPKGDMAVDSIVAFGCLHAGSVHTDIPAFLNSVSAAMIERDARTLVGAGDFIEGLKHNLVLRGEVYGGMNDTDQEKLAGRMIGEVRFRAFAPRFLAQLRENSSEWKKLGVASLQKSLQEALKDSLDTFVHIPGNHDDWKKDAGWTPLAFMLHEMVGYMRRKIEKLLLEHDFVLGGLADIIMAKTVKGPKYTLPSGLRMEVMHPHMARAQTTSIRPQQMLAKSDCHIVIGANFHAGEHLEEFRPDLGQRVCLQLGTMKHRTDFEDSKLKIVDFGFGWVSVSSVNGRIVKTENTFYSEKVQGAPLDNNRIMLDLLRAHNLEE